MQQEEQTRRSVTIRPELNVQLRDFVAACIRNGIDLDYTKALNLFAELGQRWLEETGPANWGKARQIWDRYLDFEKFDESEAPNYWYEYQEFRRWKASSKKNATRWKHAKES